MTGADALDHALALRSRPDALGAMRRRPLPDAVLLLIRIAAGDRHAIRTAQARCALDETALTDVSAAWLRQTLFAADADHYRLLGVHEDADENLLKEHHRWLIRWLHPDRGPNRGGESDAQRVNRAWHVLRSDERRRDYDRQHGWRIPRLPPQATVRPPQPFHPAPNSPPRQLLSQRAVRHLPEWVLGGMALVAAVALVGWHWMDQRPDVPSESSRIARYAAKTGSVSAGPGPASSLTVIATRNQGLAASAATSATKASPADQEVPVRAAALKLMTSSRSEPDADVATATIAGPDRARPYVKVVDEFASAYAQGDLDRMMGLFASDAHDDQGDLATIADEFGQLFRQTRSRRLAVGEWTWNANSGRVSGAGVFDASIQRNGQRNVRNLRGRIELELVPVGDAWKIRRVSMRQDGT